MPLYDITRTVAPTLKVWPGDAAYAAAPALQIHNGAPVNLMTLTLSPHTGTHADSYYHYRAEGAHPATMPLEKYIGAARVLTVSKRDGGLTPGDFPTGSLIGVQRLLIHSHVSDLSDDVWPEHFPHLTIELIDYLKTQGCVLIGLDSPSVDDFNSKSLPCHHALFQAGMVNLETLQLCDVPDGAYELIALPLKLDLACGSPVRAVLRS
jgi:arylformamidase